MTAQELAIKIIEINHATRTQAQDNPTGDWELMLGRALDKIVALCHEQLNTQPTDDVTEVLLSSLTPMLRNRILATTPSLTTHTIDNPERMT